MARLGPSLFVAFLFTAAGWAAQTTSSTGSGSGTPTRAAPAPLPDGDGDGTPDARDCAPTDPARHPGARELCDGQDNDCDGKTDEPDAADASAFYKDADGDSFGNKLSPTRACAAPAGYVADATDCNDGSSAAKPGGSEVCDGLDNDCDGVKDEADASDAGTWYQDKDLDKVGNSAVSKAACKVPTGYVATSGDCDDARANAKPGGTETCDGIDNNCDGAVDEPEAVNAKTWFKDADSDGFGDKESTRRACALPEGYLAAAGDCDDGASAVNPKGAEVCDGKDNDCDGKIDEPDARDASAFYKDVDGDGFGNKLAPTRACAAPAGFVADATDCNDGSSSSKPGNTEVCDGLDNDCDGVKDEADASDAKTWYQDKDLDKAGNAAISKVACYAPAGFIASADDCDDARASARPGGTEICDGIDNNCDGTVDEPAASNAKTWFKDADSDGYGDKESTTRACTQPGGYLAAAGDCDDGASAVNPKGTELCDGKDNDCDGKTDEPEATDAKSWFKDADGDRFGNKLASLRACEQPSGYVADNADCNDASTAANPSATEVCDGLDNNCDGLKDQADAADAKTWYQDKDLDRYGDAGSSKKACYLPTGFVANSDDCDDVKGAVKPGGTELCDGIDNDCDGSTDEPDAANAKTWYRDADSDSFGGRGDSTRACSAPTGYVADARDCDDSTGSVSPSATESCDDRDNDCDGKTDEPDASDAKTWYADTDTDAYGDAKSTTRACTQPRGYVPDSSDCNPRIGSVNPGADERCNGMDDDCDGATDEDEAVDAKTWYRDSDGDRFGASFSSAKACKVPSGYVADSTDCDDTSNLAKPGGLEVCDNLDNDCDGTTDEDDARGAPTWYKDSDDDGFGDRGSSKVACKAPSGFTENATDCDDKLSTTYPGAPESCDGKDNDCNAGNESGLVTFLATGGGREDLTSTFGAGSSSKPVSWRATRAGTVTFCDGTYYANLDLKVPGLTVQSLNGRDSTSLDGGASGSVITASADATIRGLTLRNGKNGDSGGGVLVMGGNVTVSQSRITDNEATSFGGGLYAQRGTLRLVDTSVANNKAHSGGGVYGYYAAMVLEDCAVTGNTAVDGAGLYARFSSLDLSGGSVSGNAASSQGGGVQLYGGARLSCRASTSFTDNSAERGAAMHVSEKSEVRAESCDMSGGSQDIFVDGGGPYQFAAGANFTCKVPDGCKGG